MLASWAWYQIQRIQYNKRGPKHVYQFVIYPNQVFALNMSTFGCTRLYRCGHFPSRGGHSQNLAGVPRPSPVSSIKSFHSHVTWGNCAASPPCCKNMLSCYGIGTSERDRLLGNVISPAERVWRGSRKWCWTPGNLLSGCHEMHEEGLI